MSAMLRFLWFFLSLVIPVHIYYLQICPEVFQHGAYFTIPVQRMLLFGM